MNIPIAKLDKWNGVEIAKKLAKLIRSHRDGLTDEEVLSTIQRYADPQIGDDGTQLLIEELSMDLAREVSTMNDPHYVGDLTIDGVTYFGQWESEFAEKVNELNMQVAQLRQNIAELDKELGL